MAKIYINNGQVLCKACHNNITFNNGENIC